MKTTNKTFLCLALASTLIGCAVPKSPLTDAQYDTMGSAWMGIRKCSNEGKLSPDIAASGLNAITERLHKYDYDDVKMQAAMDKYQRMVVSTAYCNKEAVGIARLKQSEQENRAWVAQRNQENQNAVTNFQNMMPKQTYCNKFGYQVMCNTY